MFGSKGGTPSSPRTVAGESRVPPAPAAVVLERHENTARRPPSLTESPGRTALPPLSLPPLDPLLSLSDDFYRALGQRLRALETAPAAATLDGIAPNSFGPAGRPVRLWHLRRSQRPVAAVLRAFVMADPTPYRELAAALGAETVARLLDVGLLVPDRDELVGALRLIAHAGALLFCDDLALGGNAVMGAGPYTTPLLESALPTRRVGLAHDLGCGAGALAIGLAPRAERVIATDLNPRAVALARLSVLLNDVHNVTVREGDLFAPLGAERPDLVVTQPPFLPRPPGANHAVFRDGGVRGDEVLRRLVAELPERLAVEGRALIVALVVAGSNGSSTSVVEGFAETEVDLIALFAPGPDLDDFCAGNAAWNHPSLDEHHAAQACAMRSHLAELGAERLEHLTLLLERREESRVWSVVPCDTIARALPPGPKIDAHFAMERLLAGGEARILDSRARLVEDATLGHLTGLGQAHAVLPPHAPWGELWLDEESRNVILEIHETPTVREGLASYARRADLRDKGESLLPIVLSALRARLLEVESTEST